MEHLPKEKANCNSSVRTQFFEPIQLFIASLIAPLDIENAHFHRENIIAL